MEILKAVPSDLVEILYLLRVCITDMNKKGMKQWNSAHPDKQLVRQFLEEGKIYVVKDAGVCKGMISISNQIPDDYFEILKNSDESKTMFIQWLAIHPLWQGKGIAKILIDFAEKYARKNKFSNIKLDVFRDSETANLIMKNNNYSEIGRFHTKFQKIPFICYEKRID